MAIQCGEPEEGRCHRGDIATIYACVGIVLAGGKNNHNGGATHRRVQGVRSFRPEAESLGLPVEDSGFAVGFRPRGGACFLEGTADGYFGASLVFGSVTAPRVDNRFAFFLGGVGFEYFPSVQSALFAVQFQGGGSIGGLLLSGGVDFAFGPGGGYVLFGGEVGFGGSV